jgi:hypothetical protein
VGILKKVDIVIAVLAASAFLAAAVLMLGRVGAFAKERRATARGARSGRVRSRGAEGTGGSRTCPLCSSRLDGGERVKSKLFPGRGDRIMHIFGCPRCWPSTPTADAAPRPRRICPVCGAEIGREGWAVARYFERAAGAGGGNRAHVHVLGCTECRG